MNQSEEKILIATLNSLQVCINDLHDRVTTLERQSQTQDELINVMYAKLDGRIEKKEQAEFKEIEEIMCKLATDLGGVLMKVGKDGKCEPVSKE